MIIEKKKMLIRNKIIFIILVCSIVFVSFMAIFSYNFLLKNFASLEDDQVIRNINRIEASFDSINANQFNKAQDWAYWNDTYEFIEDKNKEYIESNLTNESVSSLKINLMVFVNDKDEIVHSKFIDLGASDLPQDEVLSYIKDNIDSIKKIDESSKNNFIKIKDGEMIISVKQILKSDQTGPSRGILIFGSFVNKDMVDDISNIVGLPVYFYPYNSYIDVNEVAIAKNNLSKTNEQFIYRRSTNLVDGFMQLYNINDNPIALLKVELPRDIYNDGRDVLSTLLVIVSLFVFMMSLVMLILLERFFIHRLIKLEEEVSIISQSGDLSKNVEEGERDEIGSLANVINNMFKKISIAQEKEKEFDKEAKIANEKIKQHIEETDKLNQLMVGRELKMIELKKENIKLKNGEDNN